MKKIWVITFDEVSDFENFRNCPCAFEKEEDARKALAQYKKSIKEDYAEELEDGWEYDERDYWVEVWNSVSYARDHFAVLLSCVDLQ